MKRYVFTVKDDVCNMNGKDVTATGLLSKMREYGTVEGYDTVISAIKSEYQKIIDNLTVQYNGIKDLNLSEEEIRLVNTYRECRAATVKVLNENIDTLKKQLNDIKNEYENRIEQIKNIIG